MKVIKVGARWCPGCLVMRPRWERVEKKLNWLKTEYWDFDDKEGELKEMGIEAERLPVFVFLNDRGEEIERLQGEIEEKKLVEEIERIRGKEER